MELNQDQEYTFSGNPVLEKKVENIINEITNEIIHHLSPKAVILIGSFGRGEAIVKKYDQKLEFISDLDVIVISNRLLLSPHLWRIKILFYIFFFFFFKTYFFKA